MFKPEILIPIIAGAVIVVAIVVTLIIVLAKKKKTPAKSIPNRSEYFLALGGEGNFIKAERSGSRIVVYLHDYSLIDKEKIKEAGVAGFIEKSDKLTLVVKDNAEAVYEKIFNA